MTKDNYFLHVPTTQTSFRVAGVKENTLFSRKIEGMQFAWQAWDKIDIKLLFHCVLCVYMRVVS